LTVLYVAYSLDSGVQGAHRKTPTLWEPPKTLGIGLR